MFIEILCFSCLITPCTIFLFIISSVIVFTYTTIIFRQIIKLLYICRLIFYYRAICYLLHQPISKCLCSICVKTCPTIMMSIFICILINYIWCSHMTVIPYWSPPPYIVSEIMSWICFLILFFFFPVFLS